jgi:hypothetical protein
VALVAVATFGPACLPTARAPLEVRPQSLAQCRIRETAGPEHRTVECPHLTVVAAPVQLSSQLPLEHALRVNADLVTRARGGAHTQTSVELEGESWLAFQIDAPATEPTWRTLITAVPVPGGARTLLCTFELERSEAGGQCLEVFAALTRALPRRTQPAEWIVPGPGGHLDFAGRDLRLDPRCDLGEAHELTCGEAQLAWVSFAAAAEEETALPGDFACRLDGTKARCRRSGEQGGERGQQIIQAEGELRGQAVRVVCRFRPEQRRIPPPCDQVLEVE